jgi:hypothetical protein
MSGLLVSGDVDAARERSTVGLVSRANGDDLRVVRGDDRHSWAILGRRLLGRVDPDGFGRLPRRGGPLTRRSGWALVGSEPHAVTSSEDLVGAAVMQRRRREEGQAAVVVLGVAPGEQRAAS